MIPEMAAIPCDCCGRALTLAVTLRRRAVRAGAGPAFETRDHPLCAPCVEWLTGLILQAREPLGGLPRLFGAPQAQDRPLEPERQCHLCRGDLGASWSAIEWLDLSSEHRTWIGWHLCPSCDGWLASLADDGRSARRSATRDLDGAYGEWLHPSLGHLAVALEVRDRAVRATIERTCAEMGVAVSRLGVGPVDALFRQVPVWEPKHPIPPRGAPYLILLAPIVGHDALLAGLSAGAAEWLTIPVTPQQVTAALVRAARQWRHRCPWDEATALPSVVLDGSDRPVLVVEPAPGVDQFELAWMLKRFLRGYDEVVVVDGEIAVLPLVRPDGVDAVVDRMRRTLGSWCSVGRRALKGRTGFEAAG